MLSKARNLLVFGANTDVGKSVVSAGLVRSACALIGSKHTLYCKPLQTGTEEGHSDERFVRNVTSWRLGEDAASQLSMQTLFAWPPAISPYHAAQQLLAETGVAPTSDEEVLCSMQATLQAFDSAGRLNIFETAGGVLSPTSSGSLQADLYKCSGVLDVLFVGDGRLGGISATLSSLESLLSRGFSVRAVAMIEDEDARFGNVPFLKDVAFKPHSIVPFQKDIPVVSFKPLPQLPLPLDQWYVENDAHFDSLLHILLN